MAFFGLCSATANAPIQIVVQTAIAPKSVALVDFYLTNIQPKNTKQIRVIAAMPMKGILK